MYNIVYWSFIFDLFNREFQRYIENVIHVDPFNVIFKKSLYYRKDSRNGPVIGVQTYGQVKKNNFVACCIPYYRWNYMYTDTKFEKKEKLGEREREKFKKKRKK